MLLFRNILTSCNIRVKLLLLLLIIFIPAFGLVIASGFGHRKYEIATAKENALLLVQSLAAQQEQIATGTKQMLSTLAQLPEVKNLDAEKCNRLFRDLNNQHSFYSIIAAATPDGNMFAASVPFQAGSVTLSDRKHIRDVIRTRDFAAGEYIIGRISGVQSMNYTYPVLDTNKTLIGIVIAGFKLDEYARFIKKANLLEGSAVTITDHVGVRLYRYPEHEAALPGKRLPEDVVKQMMGDSEQGIFERMGQDGIERIYAFRQLHLRENTSPYLYMDVGLPREEMIQKANLEMMHSLFILGVLCLSAMSLAWVFGHFVFVKPINHLVIATRRLGSGEMGTRASLRPTSDELGRLAESFDAMASLLEQRNTEREDAEESLRKAEEKYRNIFENAVGGIFMNTPEGRFIEANHALARILGYASPEELKDAIQDIRHQLYTDPVRGQACIQAVLDHGEAVFEIEVRKKDGSTGWVSNHVRVVRDVRGEVSHFEGVVEDINERRRTEERLQDREKSLRRAHSFSHSIIENVTEGLCVCHETATFPFVKFIIWNDRMIQIAGYTMEEINRLGWYQMVYPDPELQAKAIERMRGMRQGENLRAEEWEITRADGNKRVLSISTSIVESDNGLVHVLALMQDITERKAAQDELDRHREHLEDLVEERTSELAGAIEQLSREVNERKRIENQLRESEAKYRTLVEQIPAITYIAAMGKRFSTVYVSPQVESMLGFTQEESIADQRLKAKILHPDDRERVLSQLIKLKQDGGPFSAEYRMIDRKGTVKWFRDEARVVRDESGKAIFLHGVMLDISDRKRMEEALRYSENLYRTVFETTGTAMILVEEDTTISLVNAQYEKVLGFSKEKVEGKLSWTASVPKEDLERYRSYHSLRRVNADLAPKQYEAQIIDSNGRKRDFLTTVGMIPDSKRSVASLLDITERKQTERALEQSVAELNNLQCITRKLLQLEELSSVMRSIGEGIVENLGYDMALVACYAETERVLTGLVLYPTHLESVMDQYLADGPTGTLWDRRLKCPAEQDSVMDRVLKGETVIGDTLAPFISHWVSSSDARTIQELTGRAGYISLPMQVKGETVGVILAGWNDNKNDLERMRSALDRVADQAAVAVKSAGLFECIKSQRGELRALASKLQQVQEAERKSLAQELHDRVGQNLTGLSINLGIIRSRLLPMCMERVQSRIADSVGLVGNTMECIRDVMAELHPPGLTEYGLSAALKGYCDQLSKRTGLKVSMKLMKTDELSERECEIALFRIAQEALTNAVKHSRAHEVTVSLESFEGKLVLCIADDGVGFDLDAQESLTEGGRFGLVNMRERAEAVGGEFRMESAPGRGTRVIVTLEQVTS